MNFPKPLQNAGCATLIIIICLVRSISYYQTHPLTLGGALVAILGFGFFGYGIWHNYKKL